MICAKCAEAADLTEDLKSVRVGNRIWSAYKKEIEDLRNECPKNTFCDNQHVYKENEPYAFGAVHNGYGTEVASPQRTQV